MQSAVQHGLEPGCQFGRYLIHELIARGGMGEVWLATASGPGGFQKKVVIKTVLPALAERTEYVEMLINEASLAAQLSHPNIVQVFDLGCQNGLYYIAMEYISGRTLAQVLQQSLRQRNPVPPWIASTVVAHCCDGLQYAHDFTDDEGNSLGLLHRDVSPSNVMLSHAGNVTILDFGIAIATRGEEQTQSGAIKGKYHYMAPERIRGLPANRRCDVYSLGVVFYQLLSWRRPFHADSDFDLLRSIVHDQPTPLLEQAPWLDPQLAAIVMRAIAHEPDDRFADAASFAAAIRQHLRESGVVCEARDLSVYLQSMFGDGSAGSARSSAPPAVPGARRGAPVARPGPSGATADEPPAEMSASIELDLSFSLSAPLLEGLLVEERSEEPGRPAGTPSPRRAPRPLAGSTQSPGGSRPQPLAQGSSAPIFPQRRAPVAPAVAIEPPERSAPLDSAASAAVAADAAPHGSNNTADIFTSALRRPPAGADLFGGYQRRSARAAPESEEPAFVRSGREQPPAWPFARRADTRPGTSSDDEAGFFVSRKPDDRA